MADEVFRVWEIEPLPASEIKEPYDYAVVLGGVAYYDSHIDKLGGVRSFDRVMQAVELYKTGKVKKIFLSGGSGSIIEDDFVESEIVRRFLIKIGIPENDVEFEANSKNTRENAIQTAKYLLTDSLKNKKLLLITSAFHMRRALGCFKKVGFNVVPFVADRYSGPRKYIIDHLIIPNTDAITNWTLIIHEIVGYVVYYLVGYL